MMSKWWTKEMAGKRNQPHPWAWAEGRYEVVTSCEEREHTWAPPLEDKPNWLTCTQCSTEHYVAPGSLLRWRRIQKEKA